jgi:hypothetical protein
LFSGFYAKFWGAIDTFAPYALVGSLCLVVLGAAMKPPQRHTILLWLGAGALAGLGHLTRADGLLLLIVGALMAGWLWARHVVPLQTAFLSLAALVIGYLFVMLPYFARNLNEIGTPLPLGGTQAIWFDEYNDLFNYPPDASPSTLFAEGLGAFVDSRREALVNNAGTFVAVEGWVIVTPLMLIGLWKRRRDPFLLPFALYALGLHLAMTFVFPFPGYRGGLLHAAAALIPFWAALGVAGLDDVVDWVAKRRRHWNAKTAKMVFSGGLVAVAAGLTVYIGASGRVTPQMPPLYAELRERLPAGARILSDDPAELFYYTGMGGAVLPNAPPETLLEIARRYGIDYLLIKPDAAGVPAPLARALHANENLPDFLTPLPFDTARLYAIEH